MKKSSLKDWFKIEVWRQSGGTLPELCDLADIREWLNETTFADGVGIVSVVEKLNERTVINNGVIVHPTQAYLELVKAGNGIRLDAVEYGSQGNEIKFSCKNGDELLVDISGLRIAVIAPIGTTTFGDVVTAINDDTDANKLVTASVIGNGSALMIPVTETPLADGEDVTYGEDGEVFFDGVNIYVSDGESKKDVDNWLSAPLLPTLPTVIDLSNAKTDYVIEEGKKNSIVVLTDSNGYGIVLPAAIVGLRVTTINQVDELDVDIYPAGDDYINGKSEADPFALAALTSATFYCYANGYWATI